MFLWGGGRPERERGRGTRTKVCIECIGQFFVFVCPSRTRKRVRLVHTKTKNCPLQSTQHSLCESPARVFALAWGWEAEIHYWGGVLTGMKNVVK